MPIVIMSYRSDRDTYCGNGDYQNYCKSDFTLATVDTTDEVIAWLEQRLRPLPEATYVNLVLLGTVDSLYHASFDEAAGEDSIYLPGADQETATAQATREALAEQIQQAVAQRLGNASQAYRRQQEAERRQREAERARQELDACNRRWAAGAPARRARAEAEAAAQEVKDQATYLRLKAKYEPPPPGGPSS